MNADLLNELKTKYRTHLSSADGRKQLTEAIEIKKKWKSQVDNTDIQIATAGVKTKYINSGLNKKITKLEIIPIGINNMCHFTSQLFCDDKKGITKSLGYNITACPCGKLMSYELHSVNKYGGQLYDFTKDFNDEKSKYFLELDTNMSASLFIHMFGKDPIAINKGCKCPISWNINKYLKTETELLEDIEYVENVNIKETSFGYTLQRKCKV